MNYPKVITFLVTGRNVDREYRTYIEQWRKSNMKQTDDLPYLEKRDNGKDLTKEDMIYGGGETLSEIRKKDECLQLITE